VANASRNAQAGFERRRRWAPARDALWEFVAPHLEDGARVAIVGAGNGDDLPLRRIAERAGAVSLIDIDPRAAEGARRQLGRTERPKVTVLGHDVTEGAADSIALAALHGRQPGVSRRNLPAVVPPGDAGLPLPGAPYDFVIGDLLYSQLLYPALLDLGVEDDRREDTLREHAPGLIRDVVARLHASAPLVVHVHDPLAWWDGHDQPVTLEEVLDRPDLAARGVGPHESDPRRALEDLGLSVAATALWRWPFSRGVDYLARATLARGG
jgi:hypothetical protein